jgi:hypothetical protein
MSVFLGHDVKERVSRLLSIDYVSSNTGGRVICSVIIRRQSMYAHAIYSIPETLTWKNWKH